MRARYYNVDVKRFVNQDVVTGTLERISSLNRYAYVEGNPVSYLDPFGLEKNFIDDLHEGIEQVQDVIAILMIALTITAAIGTMTGNLALNVYSAYYFAFLYKTTSVLSAINAFLYGYDLATDKNNDTRFNDAVNFVKNVVSIWGPVDKISKEKYILFDEMSRIQEVINILKDVDCDYVTICCEYHLGNGKQMNNVTSNVLSTLDIK